MFVLPILLFKTILSRKHDYHCYLYFTRTHTHTHTCMHVIFIEYWLKATKAKRKGGCGAIVEDGWRFYRLLPCDTALYRVTVG